MYILFYCISWSFLCRKSNKVEALSESQEDLAQGGSQGHRQVGQGGSQGQRHQLGRGIGPNLQHQKHHTVQAHQISVVPVEEVEI